MDLIRRVEAAQVTLDKYQHANFKWGRVDCAHLVADHLRQFEITTALDQARPYQSEIGAKRAMRKLGANDLPTFIDRLGLSRISPAEALPGDIMGLPGGTEERQWTALAVAMGDGRLLAFADIGAGHPVGALGPIDVATLAWRVL